MRGKYERKRANEKNRVLEGALAVLAAAKRSRAKDRAEKIAKAESMVAHAKARI